jgi:hypothetical protein
MAGKMKTLNTAIFSHNSKGLGRIFHIFLEFIFAYKRSAIWYDNYNTINNNN